MKKAWTELKEGFIIGVVKSFLKRDGVTAPVVFINEPRIHVAALYSNTDNTVVFCLPRMQEYQKSLGLNLFIYLSLLTQDVARLVEMNSMSTLIEE